MQLWWWLIDTVSELMWRRWRLVLLNSVWCQRCGTVHAWCACRTKFVDFAAVIPVLDLLVAESVLEQVGLLERLRLGMSVSSRCFTSEGKEKSRSDEVCECAVGWALLEDTGAILVSLNLTGFCLEGERACGGEAIWLLSDSSSWIYKQQ